MRRHYDRHVRLFDRIAPIYRLFFKLQLNHYQRIVKEYDQRLFLQGGRKILDIGCGTGAFGCSFIGSGNELTGLDASPKMLYYAKKLCNNQHSVLLLADAVKTLPFRDKCFHAIIAGHVLHGIAQRNRINLLKESNRVALEKIVFYDYGKKRSFFTDLIEWLEGGDYFNFIENGINEMKNIFSDVHIIETGSNMVLYICTPS